MAMTRTICTIQLIINENDPARAADGVTEMLEHFGVGDSPDDFTFDWGYLKIGDQILSPQQKIMS